MPENWSLPSVTSNYATGVIQAINNKFIDAITLFRGGDGSNLPVNAIRYNGDLTGTFQRWNGTAWANMILGVAGGGTGSDNATGTRDNLGLGTMATQNSNAVNITGGNATNLTTFSSNTVYANQISTPDGQNIGNIDAAKIAIGLINPARLANGLANSSVFLRGDQTWGAPAGTLPSGMVAIFTTSCPAGWTRLAGWDGRYLRAMPTYGAVGGAYSHSHGAGSLAGSAHTHNSGSYNIPSHNHGGSVSLSGNTGASGGHSHGFSAGFGGTTNSTGYANTADAGGSFTVNAANHTHNFSGSVSGDTDSVGNHTHSISLNGTISSQASVGVSGSSGSAGGGAISGATDAADHQPPFIDVVFCQKD